MSFVNLNELMLAKDNLYIVISREKFVTTGKYYKIIDINNASNDPYRILDDLGQNHYMDDEYIREHFTFGNKVLINYMMDNFRTYSEIENDINDTLMIMSQTVIQDGDDFISNLDDVDKYCQIVSENDIVGAEKKTIFKFNKNFDFNMLHSQSFNNEEMFKIDLYMWNTILEIYMFKQAEPKKSVWVWNAELEILKSLVPVNEDIDIKLKKIIDRIIELYDTDDSVPDEILIYAILVAGPIINVWHNFHFIAHESRKTLNKIWNDIK